MQTDRCALLLDAWDEVPVEHPIDGQPVSYEARYRQRLGQRLGAFARRFSKPRILITSRIVGYTGSPIPGANEIELMSFEALQQGAFARTWFGDGSEKAKEFLALLWRSPQVNGLARIPLMLALMCRACQEEHLTFPTRRVDLYDRCVRGLLRDWRQEKEQREVSDAYVEALLEVLRETSYALFSEGYEQFSDVVLRAKMLPVLNALGPTHELYGRNSTSLIAELKLTGLLVTVGQDLGAPYLFLHRTFQEFLAAGALACQKNGLDEALQHVYDPVWREVLLLLGGMLGVRTLNYVYELLRKDEEDLAFRPFQLAAAAAAEAHPKDLPVDVVDAFVKATVSLYCEGGEVSQLLPLTTAWGERAVPHLVSHPGFYDWEFGYANPAASRALGKMGSAKAVPRLLELLMLGRRAYDRAPAAEALAQIGLGSSDTLSTVVTLLEEDGLRKVVMQILAGNPDFLGRSPGRTEPGLSALAIEGRIHSIGDLRGYVAAALKQSGAGQALSGEAVAVLVSALGETTRSRSWSEDSEKVWLSLTDILVGLGREEVGPHLLSGLTDEREVKRRTAVTLLARA